MDTTNANEGSDSQNNAASGAALLLVIGEPFSEEHKKLILEEVTKGFRSWDKEATGIDINDELAQIANKADLGEEGPNGYTSQEMIMHMKRLMPGERIIRSISEKFALEVLVNPQTQTVTLAVKNFLCTPTKHKQLIYTGHAFQGSGAWILQDDTFTFNNFASAFKDQDVDNALRQQKGSSLHLYTNSGGDWSDGHISKNNFSKILDVSLNPSDKLENIHGVLQFTAYVSNFVRVRELNELLQSSDVVGNIRFSRPTLYIFPGCQGDSALFGISGFNLLVNGGYSRKACFWDLTRHLDRIDAALMTHLGTDNLYGLGSVLQRKSIENVHPEIGFMYINASDKIKAITDGEKTDTEDSLRVNLAEEGNKLIQYAKKIGQQPHPCTRNQSSQTVEPINLFHKVGIGSLDMYILNPITDSKELKEFYQQWNQKVAQFGTNQHVPLPNTLSVCALLVWRPSDPNDNITRIFFPGNAPQHKVIEGLEKLKTLSILKHPKCTTASLQAKPAAKKPTMLASKPPAKTKPSPVTTPAPQEPKITKKEAIPVKASPRSKLASAPKAKKEDVNKKTSKAEKSKDEKTDKTKSSTSSSPSKGSMKSSTASTPKEVVTPTKEPVAETAAVVNGVESSVDPPGLSSEPLVPTHATSQEMEVPASVPEPQHAVEEPTGQHERMDKDKMLELGIYDEDQDIEEDLNIQKSQQFGGMADSMHEDLIGSADIGSSKGMQSSFHGNLMSGSMHESYDSKPFEDQGFVENGCTPVDEVTTPEDDTSEEIQPQALPEPQAYTSASYEQEPDVIPSMATKEETANLNLETTSPNEPDILPVKQDSPDEISVSQGMGEQSTAPVEPVIEQVENIKKEALTELETPDEVENTLPVDEVQTDVQEKDGTEDTEKDTAPTQEPLDKVYIQPYVQPEPTSCVDLRPRPGLTEPEEPEEMTAENDLAQSQESDNEPLDHNQVTLIEPEPKSCVDLRPRPGLAEPEEPEEPEEMNAENDLATSQEGDNEPLDNIQITVIEPDNRSCVDLRPRPGLTEPEELEGPEEVTAENDLATSQEGVKEPLGEIQVAYIPPDNTSCFDLSRPMPDFIEPELAVCPPDFTEPELAVCPPDTSEPVGDDLIPTQDFQREQSPEGFIEPEMQDLEHSESTDVADIIERPKTPEPQEIDQLDSEETDKLETVPIKPTEQQVPASKETEDERMVPVGQTKAEQESLETKNDDLERPETPESLDERADSPDSQVDAENLQRDSLEREDFKEKSPLVDSDDQRDSIERDNEQQSKESSPEDNQRDSIERSYDDDDTDDSEEDDDEDDDEQDSSSFEQEEATDEKCLIQDSVSEDQKVGLDGQKTDSLAAPYDSLLDQQSDNLLTPGSEPMLTPESETTDPSHGGQLGYHQIDDQRDQDSDEGVDSKEAYPAMPHNNNPFGQDFEQVDGAYQSGNMANPFDDMVEQPSRMNPFVGFDQRPVPQPQGSYRDSSPEMDHGSAGGPASFNPLADWGEPMGLPSPPPPESDTKKASPRQKSASKIPDKKPNGDAKKPASATLRTAKPAPKESNGVPEKSKTRPASGAGSILNSSKSTTTTANSSRLSLGGRTAPGLKTRPASAPSSDKAPPKARAPKPSANGAAKRPATATGSRTSPAAVKMPPLPAFTPYYVDLTYIPNHGNPDYSDAEFFKRIRARYYVLSALSPNTQILDALLDAKKTWEDKELAVTVIPTYDNETLRLWMALHKEKLADQKVEIAPSASRCTIQLQDHETSSSAYRLEF